MFEFRFGIYVCIVNFPLKCIWIPFDFLPAWLRRMVRLQMQVWHLLRWGSPSIGFQKRLNGYLTYREGLCEALISRTVGDNLQT